MLATRQDGALLVEQGINIGNRISELRRRRGLTQEALADKAGLSIAVIKKVEQGRGGCRIETYHAIARALNVITLAFVAPQAPEPRAADYQDAALAEIRSVINPAKGITGEPLFDTGDDEPDLGMLAQAVHAVGLAFHADRYDTVAQLVPAVVRSAHLHVSALDGTDRETALRLRADILGVAGRYLIQVREHDLALIALGNSLADALAIGDQTTAAAAISSQGWALMRQARFGEVERLCATAADQVEPVVSKASVAELSAWGYLLLRAAGAAARNNRPSEAREFLSVAAAAAAPLPREESVKSWRWGQLTVALQGPQIELLAGRPDKALELTEQLPCHTGRTMPSDWNRHGIDKAKAFVMVGDADRATEILTKLKDSAPEWLRYQQSAREVAEDILASRKRMPSETQLELADFLQAQM